MSSEWRIIYQKFFAYFAQFYKYLTKNGFQKLGYLIASLSMLCTVQWSLLNIYNSVPFEYNHILLA